MLDSTNMPADSLPIRAHSVAAKPPKRDRRKLLTKIDRRSPVGRRIDALKELFTAALSQDEISALKHLRIAEAAELKALAEQARGEYLRGGDVLLDDLVRIERKADHAVRGLGMVDRLRKPATLADYLTKAAGA
jgi:hypothetical protein